MTLLSIAPADAAHEQRDRTSEPINPLRWPSFGPPMRRWATALNVIGLLLLAVVCRCRDLGNLPGVNGDEAWYGVQAELLLHDRPIPWRTPSGNLLNPLFFVPQLAIHAIFKPSFVVLRSTAVFSGLAALVLNFWLCRRVFGRRMAIISTTVLAALPIDIAYSRLAWDASQSLLAALPCVYLPLWAIVDARRKIRLSLATVAALLLAILIHPTNLFIAPIAITCLGYAWRSKLVPAARRVAAFRPGSRRSVAWSAAAAILVVIAGSMVVQRSAGRMAWLETPLARGANISQYGEFLMNFGRLFSGATEYEYISGAIGASGSNASAQDPVRWQYVPYDLAAWIVGGSILWGIAGAIRQERPESTCLCLGYGASLIGFFLVAGPGALAPGVERYAIWMIAPAAILASIAIGSWQDRGGRAAAIATSGAIVIGWLLLLGFQTNCLDFMHDSGGNSHRTFRTAAIEPKQAALEQIIAKSEPGKPVRIVTSEWWTYWPMRYLSFAEDSSRGGQISVEQRTSAAEQALILSAGELDRGQLWFVEFTDTAACKALWQAARNARLPLRETTIVDFAGRPILSLFLVDSAADGPANVGENSESPGRLHFARQSRHPIVEKKIKELDLTSRVSELRFLSGNDDRS
ncbi:MAG TPA: hypothetical protein VHX65_10005 [Pirellulales bacterium]|jgi:hypothetical protein|nr:hypothetical protein [Pirellulales bacterium]